MEVPGFTVFEEVYRGRTRVVYRGRREADGVPVILKTSAEALPAAASLQREYDLIKDLDLPGVARAYGLFRRRRLKIPDESNWNHARTVMSFHRRQDSIFSSKLAR